MDCIFCRIASKQAPADIVYEDSDLVVFPDIRPKAPTHLLVIPKRHIASLQDATERDTELLGKLLVAAQRTAKERQLKGYGLAMNVGKEGGQEVDHIHIHLLADASSS